MSPGRQIASCVGFLPQAFARQTIGALGQSCCVRTVQTPGTPMRAADLVHLPPHHAVGGTMRFVGDDPAWQEGQEAFFRGPRPGEQILILGLDSTAKAAGLDQAPFPHRLSGGGSGHARQPGLTCRFRPGRTARHPVQRQGTRQDSGIASCRRSPRRGSRKRPDPGHCLTRRPEDQCWGNARSGLVLATWQTLLACRIESRPLLAREPARPHPQRLI
jgi:hypothetical protein